MCGYFNSLCELENDSRDHYVICMTTKSSFFLQYVEKSCFFGGYVVRWFT